MQNLNLSWENIVAFAGTLVLGARILIKILPDPKVDGYLEHFIDLLKHLGLSVDPVSDAVIPPAAPVVPVAIQSPATPVK